MKVVYARLQTNAYVPGAGEIGNVLPPQSKVLESLEMKVSESFLYVSFKYRGIVKELGVPLANVSLVEFAPKE